MLSINIQIFFIENHAKSSFYMILDKNSLSLMKYSINYLNKSLDREGNNFFFSAKNDMFVQQSVKITSVYLGMYLSLYYRAYANAPISVRSYS